MKHSLIRRQFIDIYNSLNFRRLLHGTNILVCLYHLFALFLFVCLFVCCFVFFTLVRKCNKRESNIRKKKHKKNNEQKRKRKKKTKKKNKKLFKIVLK